MAALQKELDTEKVLLKNSQKLKRVSKLNQSRVRPTADYAFPYGEVPNPKSEESTTNQLMRIARNQKQIKHEAFYHGSQR